MTIVMVKMVEFLPRSADNAHMGTKKERVYSRYTKEAAALFGRHIQLGRKERNLREMDLAERAGISRATLQKIEKGDLKCELGLYFEVAALVNVPLFQVASDSTFALNIDRINNKITLLPKAIHKKKKEVDDAF
jgi:DNA-binding XRE family transcriptional regulator